MKCPKCGAEYPGDSKYCKNCAFPLHSDDKTSVFSGKVYFGPERDLSRGTIVAGKYKIVEKLGGGGMGVVYKALDNKLERLVALKFLSSELTTDEDARRRFVQEAKAASVLDHQNICTIYEIDETEDGKMYIAMAYYEGGTLKQKLTRGALPFEKALDIIIQVAEGLSKANSNGIIHRDIKPANIMITEENVVKIVDFGLAKLVNKVEGTRTSAITGTMGYMSPEQVRGEDIDQRTDIWALGIVFYEMLTNRLPFLGEKEVDSIHNILYKSLPVLSESRKDVPAECERIILRSLRKNPRERYSSARIFLSDLKKLKASLGTDKTVNAEDKKEGKAETERRQATVFSAGITGYAEIFENMDPEEAAAILDSCFTLFVSAVRKYGGWAQKEFGSNFSAYFGVPYAVEEAHIQAINSAIEFRRRLEKLNESKNLYVPLGVKAGINTGMVIAGLMGEEGKKVYTITGETVILSSVMRDKASPGKIYTGPITTRFSKQTFDFGKAKPVSIKGKAKPVSAFELLSASEMIERVRLGTERMVESSLVGREAELDKLEYHLLKVINGEGSILNIIGEAGIGKSRLIAEFKTREALKKVKFLEGQALAAGKNLSFHPITGLIKKWAEIKEDENSSASSSKLMKMIRNTYPEKADEVYPFLATLMGMKLAGKHEDRLKGIEGEALEKLILKNLRDLLRTASDKSPVVFLMEDLHWADLSSIDLLESLYRLAEENRIFFINVFRPGYMETSERLLRSIMDRYGDRQSKIFLDSLDSKESAYLVNNLLKIKGLPRNIQNVLTERTGGNPFFIEEVVRSFIDVGAVEVKDGRFKVTDKIDTVEIPRTISEVLLGRIDRLDEQTRSLLKIASVIGRNFFYKILADVADKIENIDDKLDYLQEVQLIIERRRMKEVEYLFKHTLIQEAAYESLLLKKRMELHLRIAQSIERVFSGRISEFYGLLALHYSKAEDLDKAEEYMVKAGEEALKASASIEALHYYQEALNIYLRKYGKSADPQKVANLEKNIALALFNKGHYAESDEYFEKALAFYGEKFPKHPALIMLKFLRGFLVFLFRLYVPLRSKKIPSQRDKNIISLLYKKDTALIVIDPKRMVIESHYWLKRLFKFDLTKVENGVGILAISSGTFSYSGKSFRLSKKVLGFVRDKIDEKDKKSLLYYKVGKVLQNIFSGDWDAAEKYDENFINANLQIGEIFYTSSYILIISYLFVDRGEYSSGMDLSRKLLEIADMYENDNARVAYYWYTTKVLLKFRKLPEAFFMVEEGIEFADKTGFKPYLFSLTAYRARLSLFLDEPEEAERSLQYLESLKSEVNLVPYFWHSFLVSQVCFELYHLELAQKNGNRPMYAEYRKKTRKTAKQIASNSKKWAPDRVESFRLIGSVYWISGKKKKALKWWGKGLKEGDRLNARLELSRLFKEVGRRMFEEKTISASFHGMDAQELLEKAESMFREMELEWDLEKWEKGQPAV
ncbi:MAG: protein kinase [Candidatus Aminicenantes bacterium]|nr:protein kinase [Candidatus Aminicenantes bacterium]